MSRFGPDAQPAPDLNLSFKPPVVILVEPQMGENIGMVARAMANFGWRRLRLVKPRDGWPNAKAVATASHAVDVVDATEVFDTLEEALGDLTHVFATSARKHDLAKTVLGPAEAANVSVGCAGDDVDPGRVGYVFGREAWGLTNDEVVLCDDILTLPVDPTYASLNIAQATLLCAYEWRRAALAKNGMEAERDCLPVQTPERSPLANKRMLISLFEHLEGLLTVSGFFRPPEKREGMIRNLRTLFQRARLNEQEVKTLRGVFSSLDRVHKRPLDKTQRLNRAQVQPLDECARKTGE